MSLLKHAASCMLMLQALDSAAIAVVDAAATAHMLELLLLLLEEEFQAMVTVLCVENTTRGVTY